MDYKRNVRGFVFVSFLFSFVFSSVFSDVTYTLHLDGVDAGIADQIATSVNEAVALYNQHGSFNKSLNIYYSSGVPTAQANYDGVITFGGSRNTRVALHEMLHTLGTGTIWQWGNNVSGGVWTGANGVAQIQAFEGGGSVISSDGTHFWPYGLNYDNEYSTLNRFRSIRMMASFAADMGAYVSVIQEPSYQNVSAGSTAVFSVSVVGSSSYAWYKQGNPSPLTNGGDISGATTNTLQIVNAELADEGRYYCVSGGLTSRPASLMILKATPQLVGYWQFDGNANDSAGPNNGTVTGVSPGYATVETRQAIDLDGDYVTLPAGVANYNDITIAAWVYWDGGGNWQRIFDFGNSSTTGYMFLTPSSGSNTLRFGITTTSNGSEQGIETSQLTTGAWVHVAVRLNGNVGTLFVNGSPVATNSAMTINPSDFNPANNYIGDSQWVGDPLFSGLIDDFRIYNDALSNVQIAAIAASTTAPSFTEDPIMNLDAIEWSDYMGTALTEYVDAPFGMEGLTFSKDDGPRWLVVASDGTLSGVPNDSDVGLNEFTVRVTDNVGLYDTAQMTIQVANIYSGTQGTEDLIGLADQWLMTDCTDVPPCGGADLDGDNNVTFTDFSLLGYNWLVDYDLQLHLKFDEMTGAVAGDSSVYDRPGQLVNGPTWSAGHDGGALTFDGNNYVEVADDAGLNPNTDSWSVAFWMKSDTASQGALIVSKRQNTSPYPGYLIGLSNGTPTTFTAGSRLTFLITADSGDRKGGYTTNDIVFNEWTHVCVVLDQDADTVYVYINGVSVSIIRTPDNPLPTINTTTPVYIGKNPSVSSKPYYGLVDDVRIYNIALSEQEVQEIAGP